MFLLSVKVPSNNLDSSKTSMVFSSPSCVANQIGMIITAAKNKGPRMVIMTNDFFLTLVKYSLLIISKILFKTGLLFFYHCNKNFIDGGNFFYKGMYLCFVNQHSQEIVWSLVFCNLDNSIKVVVFERHRRKNLTI